MGMMRLVCAGCLWAVTSVAAEPVRSGRATAEWWAESPAVRPGGTLRTAVRLVLDPHWHTYWVNPGEAGMPTSAEWTLPAGWKAGVFSHPLPKAFRTGELSGYGHEGTVFFPVEFTAPADFSGEIVLQGRISWLACNDDACVPGDVRLELRVRAGDPSPSAVAKEVVAAFGALPGPAPDGARLTVRDQGHHVLLIVSGKVPALTEARVFAKSPDLLDPKAKIVFSADGDVWQASVPKSPYANGPVTGLELLFLPPVPDRAFVLVP